MFRKTVSRDLNWFLLFFERFRIAEYCFVLHFQLALLIDSDCSLICKCWRFICSLTKSHSLIHDARFVTKRRSLFWFIHAYSTATTFRRRDVNANYEKWSCEIMKVASIVKKIRYILVYNVQYADFFSNTQQSFLVGLFHLQRGAG